MMLEFLEINNFAESDSSQLENLYTSSFPPVETRPILKVDEMLKNQSNYHLFIVKENNSIIGFALVYIFLNLNVSLLDYMAMVPTYQRKGIGSKLLHYCINATKSYSSNLIGMLLEIQRDDVDDPVENQKRRDRIKFYARCGAKEFENALYFIPPQSGKIAEKMYLMIIPYLELDSLPKEKVVSYVKEIHSQIYQYERNDLNKKTSDNLSNPVKLISPKMNFNIED